MTSAPTHAEPDDAQRHTLLARAQAARDLAYAPYSGFRVGAALLAADGRVFSGCNVENASYGLTMCAERVAIGKAVSEGVRDFVAVAVAGPSPGEPCPPCGSCRQVLHEFGPSLHVVLEGGGGRAPMLVSIAELLPGAFTPERLEAGRTA